MGIVGYVTIQPHNLKLLVAILIEKRNGYAHDAEVIFRDKRNFAHFDGVVIVVLRVTFRVKMILLRQRQRFVRFGKIEIGEPTGVAHGDPLATVFFETISRIIIRRKEGSTSRGVSAPEFIVFNKRKNFFVR